MASSDPTAPVQINPSFFSEPDDLRITIAGLRYAREVFATSPLRTLIDCEIFPGPDISSDDELAAHSRRTVKTNYHPVGTCRMGTRHDADAVVTPDLKVRGIDGLRIVDASVMPMIPSGNTNAPVLAIADKAADLVLRDLARRGAASRMPA